MLERIARLTVPELADWCLVDILDEDGAVNQLAVAHADRAKEGLLRELLRHRRFDEAAPGTVAQVLRTGRSVLISDELDRLAVEKATGPEHLRVLRRLGGHSLMSV